MNETIDKEQNTIDKNKIKSFCDELAEIWERNPDLRFMQMISNLQSHSDCDMFYINDDIFLNKLKEYYNAN